MTTFESRAYRGAEDLPLLVEFARRQMASRAPALTYVHPGDVTWQLYLSTTESEHIRLWFDVAGLAAYAIFEAPLHSHFDIRVDSGASQALTVEILDWTEQSRRQPNHPAFRPGVRRHRCHVPDVPPWRHPHRVRGQAVCCRRF